MKISIIGAGIGGLTTAIALQQKGIDYHLFEKFPSFKPIGAGIMLANNGMQVMDKLGFTETISTNGFHFSSLNITNKKLNIVSKASTRFKKNTLKSYAIHRSKLQEILLSKIPEANISLNKELANLGEPLESNVIHFKDGSSHIYEGLIAADGIHSNIRKSLFPASKIRDPEQMCWRGVLNFQLPKVYQGQLHEMWGKGKRFGFVQINQDQTYWYALKSGKSSKLNKKELQLLFADFHSLVTEIITNTTDESILPNKIEDIKPMKQWSSGNICLIGDAAHATTPNLGQGANQAIEDAYLIAECLSKEKNYQKAFTRFQNSRQIKVNRIVKSSWNIGKMSHLSNPIMITFRNFGMRCMPSGVMQKQNEYIYTLNET